MVDTVVFTTPPTGAEAPAPAETQALAGTEKALADTKAELTRVQQELAALKKPATDAPVTPPAADAAPVTPPAVDPPAPDAAQEAAKDAVAAAGLNVAPWQTEFDTTGDVSAEGRDKIAEALKAQLGDQARQVVDDFIEGQKVRRSNQEAELIKAGGGADGYKDMVTWASKSLTKAEADLFDATVSSGDVNAALFAIRGLRSRFEAENGKRPQLITGGAPAVASDAGYASRAEMTTAMSDPRYKTDPAYRKLVEQRVLQSKF
ncbi:capsid assembly protein [Roseixanthobacter pseudopolyaromaticivorans]|uniref:capsid assembly protein n=1 Tax=Xanthobacteraceae TaxID=335928 RepID=UPI0037270904